MYPTQVLPMSRTSTLSLDSFDPDVLEAARDVARRAGVPLETWIESVVAPDAKPETGRRGRKQATAPETRQAAPRAPKPAPRPAEQPGALEQRSPPAPRTSDPLGISIDAMMQRLDALDQALVQERKASQDAAARAIEKLEGRIASALGDGAKPAGEVVERLADIERRMGELHAQLSGPRPLGRRGRPLVAEMRDAVEEVRQRQRELESGEAVARPAERGGAEAPSPAITELRRETNRLRESLGGLATGRDVGALEQAMRDLVSDVHQAKEPADLAAIAMPIEEMRVQVERLADEIADNVHARVSGEVERLAGKVDDVLQAAPPNVADRDALDGIFRELDEIRRLIAALAGPERIQSLAQGLQSISAQIAQLQGAGGGLPSGVDELKPLLEEIRSGLKGPDSAKAILGRIDALADKVERVTVNPVGDLIGRLEDLGESLRRPAGHEGDFAAIQKMLRGLAEKIDHVGSGGENLDALEQQIVGIARRLDQRGADPAVESLERMMGDLLLQVSTLRDEGAVEAAVERATRKAVAEAMGIERPGPDASGVSALRADLAEIHARQTAADERMQSTMTGLNLALERLVERLGPSSDRLALPAQPEGMASLAERLLASVTPVALQGQGAAQGAPVDAPSRSRPIRRPDARAAAPEAPRPSEELLEPGAMRPSPGPTTAAAETASTAASGTDIKANFIAAARRAAQAAQADLEAPLAPEPRGSRRPAVSAAAPATGGMVARLRAAIERRRRPLLLGLAAVVLAIGAYQVFDLGGEPARTPSSAPALVKAPEAAPKVAETPAAEPAPAARPEAVDPQTTQALAGPSPSAEKPPAPQDAALPKAAALPSIPRVAAMDALKSDLANVPPGLAALRQSALEGDGAAIFELATREADGRGMPRDLALAAKLYERLADAGYALAQFKIGSFYEKGSGVIRDLAQAKRWYEKAAEQGNIRSMHNLAVIHAENPAANGKPDFATAASWFRRAADYGVRDSQYNLAVLYARGLGVGQDLIQSYAWFSAAAVQGDEEAGRKRDDVAAKLDPQRLAAAKSMAAAYKAKPADPAVNDTPAPKPAAPAPMTLLGAPPPGPPGSSAPRHAAPRRPEPRGAQTGV